MTLLAISALYLAASKLSFKLSNQSRASPKSAVDKLGYVTVRNNLFSSETAARYELRSKKKPQIRVLLTYSTSISFSDADICFYSSSPETLLRART